jgi:hypothetical protein
VIEEVYNPDELKILLKEKDFKGRDVYWYMSDNDVDTRIMDRIIQDAWRSDIDTTGTMFEASTSYRILSLDRLKYVMDFEKDNRFY